MTVNMGSIELNDLDIKIIEEYVKDARQSYREVAKKLGVAVGTILHRVKRLEEVGVIKGYSAVVDYEKLGYELTAVTEITVSQGRLVELERSVAELPNVCAVYDVTGASDAIVVAKFKNRQELSSFTKKILSTPFVERTNTRFVLTTVKEDFRLSA